MSNNKIGPVIGLGGSAGSLSAILEICANLNHPLNATVIIANHLPYNGKSVMKELLEHHSSFSIKKVFANDQLECSTVHVSEPGRVLKPQADGRVTAYFDNLNKYRAKNINALFKAMAESSKEESIGVLLSGTNNDGHDGLKAIIEAGGIAAVQSPESADFEYMPREAIKAGLAHLDGSPAYLAQFINQAVEGLNCKTSP